MFVSMVFYTGVHRWDIDADTDVTVAVDGVSDVTVAVDVDCAADVIFGIDGATDVTNSWRRQRCRCDCWYRW